MFATDATLVTRKDACHLPVKGTNAKATARTRAPKAPSWHGNAKNLDALTHYALGASRTSAPRGRTLEPTLKDVTTFTLNKTEYKMDNPAAVKKEKQARGRHQKRHSMLLNSNS